MSLNAFDAHRSGPWDGERVCWAEGSEDPLRIITEDGVCEMYMDYTGKGRKAPVRLWEHARDADRARARGRAFRASTA